jgi:cell division inhibitor SepF
MSIWKKTLLYLGLGPDDEYADGAGVPYPEAAPAQRQAYAPPDDPGGQLSTVQPLSQGQAGAVRAQPVAQSSIQPTNVRPQPASERTVRPRPASSRAKPHVVSPHTFNDAQEVADRFKSKQPVIVNLQDVDRDLSRRIIDFSSGMCYGIGGQMERVANHVYLLTPDDVEVSAEDRQRLADGGFQI